MDDVRVSRRVWLTRFALGTGAMMTVFSLIGCGGGGGDDNGGGGGSPTGTTRSRVLALHDMSVRGSLLAGFQSVSVAAVRNGWIGGGEDIAMPPVFGDSGGTTGGSGAAADHAELAGAPMLGAFLRNIAATPPATRKARIGMQQAGVSRRSEDPGVSSPPSDDLPPPPPDVYPTEPIEPTVYFDYYLGLWVKIEYLTGGATYRLYSDEALTEPAGTITTIEPTDWESYPLIWRSEYSFRAGYLAGAHGNYESVTNRDGSGSQSYHNTYADGGSDDGRSTWTARGDYTWTSRSEFADGAGWTEGSGSFRADGGGGTRWETSDGYKGDYTYNPDGSGRARITGPDPGLPVTITWDAYGNTTIVYADGTIERIPGWGYYGGGGYGGGTTGAGGGTPVEPVPMPEPVPL